MTDEHLYRNIVAGICIVFFSLAMYFRLRSKTDEKLDRWREGPVILFGLRLSGIPVFLGGMVWLFEPEWMAWSSITLPAWIRWAGVVTSVGVGALVVWTLYTLGPNLTDTVVTRKDQYLVTTGPYRYVRHPFYLAFALGILGGSSAMANWFPLVAGSVTFVFLVVRTRIEEDMLLARFGAEYEEYTRRVGRFVPRLPKSK